MSISEIAKHVIEQLELLAPENIEIMAAGDPDWDGRTKVLVREGNTLPENVHQFGIISQKTPLTVFCISNSRIEAAELCREITAALKGEFRKMERQYNTGNTEAGIMSAVQTGTFVTNIPGRTEFQSSVSFDILNNFGL